MNTSVPPCLLLFGDIWKTGKQKALFSLLSLLISALAYSQCITPAASIGIQPGSATCNGQSFNLILTGASAGTAPFDLTINGPAGTATYNDIPPGGVITSFTPNAIKLWPAAPTPIPSTHDDASVTLGVKFRSSVAGFVKGVRFFSSDDIALGPDAYTGQLWSSGGTLLASGTFSGVTGSGWQELIFATPVLINPNTTYIASYHTKGTNYVGTTNGFTTAVSNGPLTAPDHITSGGNGVYSYGAAPSFPGNSVGSNYWVDVIFSPSTYTFNLTGIKDANECTSNGSLQTLVITSQDCSALPVTMVVNPPLTTRAVGQSFTVMVAADFSANSPGLGMDELAVHLAFDKSKLLVTSIIEQPVVSAFTSKPIPVEPVPYVNANTTGQINYAAKTTGAAPTNDFNVLAITFLVTAGEGSSTLLTLRRDAPADETKAMNNGSSLMAGVSNASININAAGCTTPTASIQTQTGSAPCNGQPFNLVLSNNTSGVAPFNLTIAGPGGTATYNNIQPGAVITQFTPPTEKLWPADPSPIPETNDDASVTLGVKFRSSVTGHVKGVRFFSPNDYALEPGAYTGQLWTAEGTLLASGTYTGVNNSNWQELIFSAPVLINANTIYVASYHTKGAKYVSTIAGLTSAHSNGSLTAPDSSSSGGNGVYSYGSTPVFPVNSVGANYWVDVIFAPNVYSFKLTGITDANGCSSTGDLQTLTISPANCNGNGTLPVTFTNVWATPKDNSALISWATSSESNNMGFDVERSTNGSNWSVMGFVKGAGNSTVTQKYSYKDENLVSGRRYYYRLKQIDIDKRFSYSAVVSAMLDAKQGFSLDQNYPNPFRGETVIKFTIAQRTQVDLSLFDMNGRLVKVLLHESRENGTHAITLNAGSLMKGIYYYKLQAGDYTAVKKLTIQ